MANSWHDVFVPIGPKTPREEEDEALRSVKPRLAAVPDRVREGDYFVSSSFFLNRDVTNRLNVVRVQTVMSPTMVLLENGKVLKFDSSGRETAWGDKYAWREAEQNAAGRWVFRQPRPRSVGIGWFQWYHRGSTPTLVKQSEQ